MSWADREALRVSRRALHGPLALAGYVTRVRGLLGARWQAIAAFGLLLATVEASRALSGMRGDPREFLTGVFGWLLIEIVTVGAGAALGPVLVEATGWRGWRGVVATVASTFAAVGAGMVAIFAFAGDLLEAQVQAGAIVSVEAFALNLLWFFAMAGLLFAAYTRVHEQEIATTRAAQAAELERAGAERALMASQLKVLQARVEPEFLFDVLEQVHALYRSAPESAEGMLDELIAYLRAALPQMRSEVSTIGSELDLVRAYLAVLRRPTGEKFRVEIRGDADVSARQFSPMVLLPLVQGALADGAACRRRIEIEVAAAGDMVRIAIAVEGGFLPETWSDNALSGMRELLQMTCGAGCAVTVTAEGEEHRATIVIPPPASALG